MPIFLVIAAIVAVIVTLPSSAAVAQVPHQNRVIDLWAEDKPAFGVFVPTENASPTSPGVFSPVPASRPTYTREASERLAENALYDFVFLSLEGAYDRAAISMLTARGAAHRQAVRRRRWGSYEWLNFTLSLTPL